MSVQCMPNGSISGRRDCEETIPDASDETMRKFGWGFVEAVPDFGSPCGVGAFYACPDHRSDCTEAQLAAARIRNAAAKAQQTEGGE
jgi:hypothetical protein